MRQDASSSDEEIGGRASRLKAAFPGTFTEDASGFVSFDMEAIRRAIGWSEPVETASGIRIERVGGAVWMHVQTQVANAISAWSWRISQEEWDRIVEAMAR